MLVTIRLELNRVLRPCGFHTRCCYRPIKASVYTRLADSCLLKLYGAFLTSRVIIERSSLIMRGFVGLQLHLQRRMLSSGLMKLRLPSRLLKMLWFPLKFFLYLIFLRLLLLKRMFPIPALVLFYIRREYLELRLCLLMKHKCLP